MNKIWFPLQRAIRTAVAVFLTASAMLATTALVAPQVVAAVQDVLPGDVVVWLAGALATLTAISAAISRVMAIPQVDEFLKRFGAGSAPKNGIAHINPDGTLVGMTRRQWRAMLDGADTGERDPLPTHNDA
ncbi:hypothetical protein MicroSTF_13980 [Microbacterium sp. STF-2]|uniref:hypothetical protein n=1 Tax=Microbacterium sp. STF-2 TaxID=3031132 RepID=UPI002AFEBA7F|nr:hypothetical protein [Microbacterium sp. STF-2]MEA1264147.1 hypothetical protein [Microbacterium sp. STF-2]